MNRSKIIFIHIPRTGGSFICKCVYDHVPIPHHNSWQSMQRDWTEQELIKLSDEEGFVHNHSLGWPEDVFRLYKRKGWSSFCVLRNPKDQLCSEYFFLKKYGDKYKKAFAKDFNTLDEYLNSPWGYSRNKIPKFYKEIDYISLFNLKQTLLDVFQVECLSTERVLESSNKGFKYYYNEGSISPRTLKAIEESDYYQTFLEISEDLSTRSFHGMMMKRRMES